MAKNKTRNTDRTMEKINGIFDIKKYKFIEDLDLAGWHLALATRRRLWLGNNLLADLERYWERPGIFRDTVKVRIEKLLLQPSAIDSPLTEQNHPSARQMNANDLLILLNILTGKYCNEKFNDPSSRAIMDAIQPHDSPDSEQKDLPEDLLKTLQEPVDILASRFLKKDQITAHFIVDLSAPIETIMQDLKESVETRSRELYKSTKIPRITEDHMSRWADSRVMAYIDLFMAAEANRIKLTDAQYAYLLFPATDDDIGDIDVVSKFRKVTKKHGKELLFDGTHFRAIEKQLGRSRTGGINGRNFSDDLRLGKLIENTFKKSGPKI